MSAPFFLALAVVTIGAGPGDGWVVGLWCAFAVFLMALALLRLFVRLGRARSARSQALSTRSAEAVAGARRGLPAAVVWSIVGGYAVLIAACVAVGVVEHSVFWFFGSLVASVGFVILAWVPVGLIWSLRAERAATRAAHRSRG